MENKFVRFRRLIFATIGATYFLIFVGGLVRVAGAGLGCPDWPRCFGRWIPPTDLSQLPAGFDPATFNITLAWIEYVNRLIGVVIGLLILATAIYALAHFRRVRHIMLPSLAALVLVAFQGWLGGQVVFSELLPVLVSVHMLVALLIVSVLIFAAWQAYRAQAPSQMAKFAMPRPLRWWLAGLLVAALVQTVLGTHVRGGLEAVLQEFPSLAPAELLARLETEVNLHATLGGALLVATLFIGWRIWQRRDQLAGAVTGLAGGAVVLAGLQMLTGIVLKYLGLPDLAKLFHLFLATIYFGIVFLLFAMAGSRQQAA